MKALPVYNVVKLGFCDQCQMSHMFMIVRLLCIHSRVLFLLPDFLWLDHNKGFLLAGIAPLCFVL